MPCVCAPAAPRDSDRPGDNTRTATGEDPLRIQKLGVDKTANVILGAGASRGASCFDKTWAQSPLDADFFEQADRLKNTKEGGVLSELISFARTEFGASEALLMEPFFTQLESLNEFHTSLKIDRGPRVRSYATQLEKFPQYLSAMFRALQEIVPAGLLECDYHNALADSLRAGDTVISFNYDCLMDAALRRRSGKSWNAKEGYGVPISSGAEAWHDHSGRGRIAASSIKLLKVHGSLNWKRDGATDLALREDPYEGGTRSKNEIVPPVWNKRVSIDAVLSQIWKTARDSLRTGPVLVVVGYSVPETDLLSQVLLRVATSERGKNLTHLVSVNPDPDARRKMRSVLQKALTEKTTLIEVRDWSQFVKLL